MTPVPIPTTDPCLTCGACCATYRVSFHWLELQSADGTVPDELTEQLTPHLACMRGTRARGGRCTALEGEVGVRVACRIYDARPSPCREFPRSGEGGVEEPRCEAARARYGLPPLVPLRWSA